MGNFQYEWWTVMIGFEDMKPSLFEVKAKSKENAIKQIKKMAAYAESEENQRKPLMERTQRVREILWDTLTLDRKGYQRLY